MRASKRNPLFKLKGFVLKTRNLGLAKTRLQKELANAVTNFFEIMMKDGTSALGFATTVNLVGLKAFDFIDSQNIASVVDMYPYIKSAKALR